MRRIYFLQDCRSCELTFHSRDLRVGVGRYLPRMLTLSTSIHRSLWSDDMANLLSKGKTTNLDTITDGEPRITLIDVLEVFRF